MMGALTIEAAAMNGLRFQNGRPVPTAVETSDSDQPVVRAPVRVASASKM
jgi:hypothetical protein